MALASIPAPTPAHKQRGLPSDAAIYRVFTYERNQRERGAVTRTAAALGISKQHVSNVLRRHPSAHLAQPTAAPTTPLTPGPLAYQPAPGEIEYTRERDHLARRLVDERLLAELLATPETSTEPAAPVAAPVNDYVNTNEEQPLTWTIEDELSTPEREEEAPPAYTTIVHAPAAAADPIAMLRWVAIFTAVVVTIGVAVVGTKAPGLAVVLLAPVLGLWHQAAVAGRLLRGRL